MKKNTFVLISLLTAHVAFSQEVVSTQGDTYSNGTGHIDFTIGEVVIDTGTDGTNFITQGFHQSSWNYVGLEDHLPTYEAKVYPNPTSDYLTISATNFTGVSCSLFDAQGKLVTQVELNSEITTIEVKDLSLGAYSLILNNDSQLLKTFKLVKNQ